MLSGGLLREQTETEKNIYVTKITGTLRFYHQLAFGSGSNKGPIKSRTKMSRSADMTAVN